MAYINLWIAFSQQGLDEYKVSIIENLAKVDNT